jgi:hypothetical protein
MQCHMVFRLFSQDIRIALDTLYPLVKTACADSMPQIINRGAVVTFNGGELKPAERDIVSNGDLLDTILSIYPSRSPPYVLLTRVFACLDEDYGYTLSKATLKGNRDMWARAEAYKLNKLLGYFRKLKRRSPGSRTEAGTSQGWGIGNMLHTPCAFVSTWCAQRVANRLWLPSSSALL